jgi:predicted dehydrogenase
MGLPLEVVIAGAGQRGAGVFAGYAERHPERMRVVAFAEPHALRREQLAKRHRVPAERSFEDWRELFAGPQLAPAAIVATRDDLHTAPALAALGAGYHVLLEKPMALDPEECHQLVEAAEAAGRILAVAHVLRYAPFYRHVYRIAREEGRLGEIQAISMAEHVAHWHFTHSYVRGKWQTTRSAAPLILSKCCHDLDLMAWLAGRPCLRVASLGALVHYRPENAPAGATARCTDGCPAEPDCLHSAPRFYARDQKGWPWSDVAPRPNAEERLEALRSGPYGLCAYRAGNDVVDRQTAILEFDGGVVGSFLVDGFASRPERTLRIQGTAGELVGSFEGGWLELRPAGSFQTEKLDLGASPLGHGGGDQGLLDHFTDIASRDALDEAATSGRSALESHLIGFAAERARVERRVVEIGELRH